MYLSSSLYNLEKKQSYQNISNWESPQTLTLLKSLSSSKDNLFFNNHVMYTQIKCSTLSHSLINIFIHYFLSQDGLCCLHYRQTVECPEIVQLLIEKGASVDISTEVSACELVFKSVMLMNALWLPQVNNLTSLTHACMIGQIQSAAALISSKANPNGLSGVCLHVCFIKMWQSLFVLLTQNIKKMCILIIF